MSTGNSWDGSIREELPEAAETPAPEETEPSTPSEPDDTIETESKKPTARVGPLVLTEEAAHEMREQLVRHQQERQDTWIKGRTGAILVSASYPRERIQRPVPVTIYLADGTDHARVQYALEEMLEAFGFDVTDRLPPVEGSWFRALVARLKTALTAKQFVDRLTKIERGIELHLMHKQQAEIDALQGDAVAKLVTALERTPSALIQIGSVLLVKVDGVTAVRNLTQQEILHIERNPNLLRSPAEILEELQKVSRPAAIEPPPRPALADQDS